MLLTVAVCFKPTILKGSFDLYLMVNQQKYYFKIKSDHKSKTI